MLRGCPSRSRSARSCGEVNLDLPLRRPSALEGQRRQGDLVIPSLELNLAPSGLGPRSSYTVTRPWVSPVPVDVSCLHNT